MKGRRILFFDPDPIVRRVAERALTSTGSEVEIAADEAALLERMAGGHDLLMVNFDPPMQMDPRWGPLFATMEQRYPRTRLVLHTTAPAETYVPLMAERRFLRNLIAKSDEPLDADELIITAEKMLSGDLFGLEKYMLWGVQPQSVEIRDSRLKLEYVQEVSGYAGRLGAGERTLELVETIVDELITNAIFNAPRDDQGRARYAHLDRREPVILEEREVGALSFACDGNYMAVAQTDPFGALTPDTLVTFLNRCLVDGPIPSDKGGGASIGFYRIFRSLSKFIVNLDPGRRTEVIALIDLRLTMKRFRQVPKSFHIFTAEPEVRHDA
jgi:CheY-like chemotaxis protein